MIRQSPKNTLNNLLVNSRARSSVGRNGSSGCSRSSRSRGAEPSDSGVNSKSGRRSQSSRQVTSTSSRRSRRSRSQSSRSSSERVSIERPSQSLRHISRRETTRVDVVDLYDKLKSRHEGCRGETENNQEIVDTVRNVLLSDGNAHEVAVDVDRKHIVAYVAVGS